MQKWEALGRAIGTPYYKSRTGPIIRVKLSVVTVFTASGGDRKTNRTIFHIWAKGNVAKWITKQITKGPDLFLTGHMQTNPENPNQMRLWADRFHPLPQVWANSQAYVDEVWSRSGEAPDSIDIPITDLENAPGIREKF